MQKCGSYGITRSPFRLAHGFGFPCLLARFGKTEQPIALSVVLVLLVPAKTPDAGHALLPSSQIFGPGWCLRPPSAGNVSC